MNLIALLIGLLVERLATQLFHLRELRGLDRVIDLGFNLERRFARVPAIVLILVPVLVLIVPLALLIVALSGSFYGLPYLIVSIVVLFFSLGPRDLAGDVDDYCKALEAGDDELAVRSARALMERDVPADPELRIVQVEEAVCVQANNRLFAVIFWFILLGPLGAWAYRVIDLVRRRAVFARSRVGHVHSDDYGDENDDNNVSQRMCDASVQLHGWLAWIPARLTAIGYGIAGDFDAAIAAWKKFRAEPGNFGFESNDRLLARVGMAALDLGDVDGDPVERSVRGAAAAKRLVFRLLIMAAVIISALTLYGWTR